MIHFKYYNNIIFLKFDTFSIFPAIFVSEIYHIKHEITSFKIIVLACLVHSYSNAQTGIFYSTDKDLSNSLINSIYQDKRDYIWIATEDGLNKFDGVKFSVYKTT